MKRMRTDPLLNHDIVKKQFVFHPKFFISFHNLLLDILFYIV